MSCSECQYLRDVLIRKNITISIQPVCHDCVQKEIERLMNQTENGNKQRKPKEKN